MPMLPGGRNFGQKGQKRANKKSVLKEFNAKFYQKWRKGAKKILKRQFFLKELYPGRETISGPGNTPPPCCLVPPTLPPTSCCTSAHTVFGGGGLKLNFSHPKRALKHCFWKNMLSSKRLLMHIGRNTSSKTWYLILQKFELRYFKATAFWSKLPSTSKWALNWVLFKGSFHFFKD